MRHFLKTVFAAAIASAVMVTSFNAQARDDKLILPIADAMDSPNFRAKLSPQVKFLFGKQAHAKPTKELGEFSSNKKTSGVGKSDKEACEWALLSALMTFQDRATKEGGNAVVNIRSYYKKNELSSETDYECHAGGIMAGVAIIGEVVTLP